ncbi:hypothetical protein VB773_10440 [Haloarculaceae archaeon H-GB2-1]|nr:hypothetical protein [Haloarculaceae archaeon H-GB2-1]
MESPESAAAATTRSPRRSESTASPTSTTVPTTSAPGMRSKSIALFQPPSLSPEAARRVQTSVSFSPHAPTRKSTSSALGVGTGTSIRYPRASTSPCPVSWTAAIVPGAIPTERLIG